MTLFGPHTQKITDIADALLEVGGVSGWGTGTGLLEEVRRLIEDPVHREGVGQAAHGILAQHRGATERNLAILRPSSP